MPEAPIVTEPDGSQWYYVDFRAKCQYPFNPDSPWFLLGAPVGFGLGRGNMPLMMQGDPGPAAEFDPVIDRTFLEWDDPTPESAELVVIRPASGGVGQKVKLKIVERRGKPGIDGKTKLSPADYGTPVAGRILQVNAAATDFEYTAQKVGGRHWPTAVTEAGAGTTGGKTLAVVAINPNLYGFPYQLSVSGGCVVTASGADCKVDLVARLGSETGPVIGRCPGIGGAVDRLILIDGPDTNTAASVVTIAANAGATVYLRAEKQAGADTFATGMSPTRFLVTAVPLP